jgi:hypothetical protein
VGQIVVVDDDSTDSSGKNISFFALIYSSVIFLRGGLQETFRNLEAGSTRN